MSFHERKKEASRRCLSRRPSAFAPSGDWRVGMFCQEREKEGPFSRSATWMYGIRAMRTAWRGPCAVLEGHTHPPGVASHGGILQETSNRACSPQPNVHDHRSSNPKPRIKQRSTRSDPPWPTMAQRATGEGSAVSYQVATRVHSACSVSPPGGAWRQVSSAHGSLCSRGICDQGNCSHSPKSNSLKAGANSSSQPSLFASAVPNRSHRCAGLE